MENNKIGVRALFPPWGEIPTGKGACYESI